MLSVFLPIQTCLRLNPFGFHLYFFPIPPLPFCPQLRLCEFFSFLQFCEVSLSSASRVSFSVSFNRHHSSINNLLHYFSSDPNASTCCFSSSKLIDLFSEAILLQYQPIKDPGRAPKLSPNKVNHPSCIIMAHR